MPDYWYAIRSKPRKEEVVWRQIRTQGYDVFYRLRVQPINPRSKKWRPYFPGYMFVRVDIEHVGLSAFQWMPHAMGLVCFGDEPAIVREPDCRH
jgi:transcriptional antiterminator RfaH